MIVASSCQHTLLVPERLFPSKCRIPATLLPIPQGQADTARQLQRGAGRGRACPWHGVGTAGIPGRGLPRIPGAARPRHGGSGLTPFRPRGRATPRPKRTGPERATKRGGAAEAPVPRARGARPGRRLRPLPAPNKARPLLGPRPPTWCL